METIGKESSDLKPRTVAILAQGSKQLPEGLQSVRRRVFLPDS